MFNKRQRREFEQKAARETKAIGSWVSVMVIRSGLRRLSNNEELGRFSVFDGLGPKKP
jgi:hypothetical protein